MAEKPSNKKAGPAKRPLKPTGGRGGRAKAPAPGIPRRDADQIKGEILATAMAELDAMVKATNEAANAIMDAAEAVDGVAADSKAGARKKLMDATSRIYEACGFQDITGQRAANVVSALALVGERIETLAATAGGKGAKAGPKRAAKGSRKPGQAARKGAVSDDDLLNGPQLEGRGKSQEEIDKLLSSFD